jgi:PAS domain S-box-containing protein
MYRIYGLAPEQLEATLAGYMSLVHPDDRGRMQSVIEAALREHQPYDVEERIVRPDGEIRILRSRGQVERDAAGQPVRLVGVCQDITEYRRAEEEVDTSEARYRTLFEYAPDGIVIADPDSY